MYITAKAAAGIYCPLLGKQPVEEQESHPAQPLQDLPLFLSLTMLTTIMTTAAARIALMIIVDRFSLKKESMLHTPYFKPGTVFAPVFMFLFAGLSSRKSMMATTAKAATEPKRLPEPVNSMPNW